MNSFDLVQQAVNEAQATQNAVERHAYRMGQLLRGNLRHCSGSDLKALKKELRAYNIHTGEWKND